MKKIFAIVLAIFTLFSFSACNQQVEQAEQEDIKYEFHWCGSSIYSHESDRKYWGDTFNGKVLSEKYAQFILKEDSSAEVWWKNEQYDGRWKDVNGDIKVIFNDETMSVAILKEYISSISQYMYYIKDSFNGYIVLSKTFI